MEGPAHAGLEVLSKPVDTFRQGLGKNAAAELAPLHPVDKMQREKRERAEAAQVKDLTAQFGIAAAMRRQADVKLLSSVHRLPGIPSSFAGLDNYTGNDLTIEMEDWLGQHEHSTQHLHGFHATMERKLGM